MKTLKTANEFFMDGIPVALRTPFSEDAAIFDAGDMIAFAERYAKYLAIEVSKAALDNAAKNVQVIYEAQEFREVDLPSITDERNIPKI